MLTLISNSHPLTEISIKSLVGYMEHHRIPVQAIYLNGCTKLYPNLIKKIISLTQDSPVIGFSLMSKDVGIFLPLVRKLREEGKRVIWGGIHPTALPADSLKECDFVCVGEGEEPLRQLYQTLVNKEYAFSTIPNIGYQEGNRIQINPCTFAVKNLDDLPSPDYQFARSYYLQGFVEGRQLIKIPHEIENRGRFFKTNSLLFYAQRGCPFSCTYCSNSLYHELSKTTKVRWFRLASVHKIKEELKHHLKYLPFVEHLWINDDDFLSRDLENINEIATFLKNDLKVTFNINATPSNITKEKVEILARNGLRQIAMGVQSGSKRILKHIYHRPVEPKQVLRTSEIISKFYSQGVTADYGFILDNPYETDDDWLESLRLLVSLPKPRNITLYSLSFFPNTALTKKALEEGYLSSIQRDFNKMYHYDIKLTYMYFLFLINATCNVPGWLNQFFMSDFMVKNPITLPVRIILAKSLVLHKMTVKGKEWLKTSPPEWIQKMLVHLLLWARTLRAKLSAHRV